MAENSESIDGNDTVWPHNVHISTAYVLHFEEVFSNVRQKFGRKQGDKMKDLDVNTSKWWISVSTTLQAAVHNENDHEENIHSIKNQPKRTLKQSFNVTGKWITKTCKVYP